MQKIFFNIYISLIVIIWGFTDAQAQIPESNEYVTADIPCRILGVMNPDNLDSVRLSVRDWVTGNEECVFGILDKLADIYIERSSFAAFSCIAAVCNNAEGKVSDYLIDINGSIFYANFVPYASYLFFYKKNYGEDHCMSKYLVSALALQIAASASESKERGVILDHIKAESKKAKLQAEVSDYIKSLYDKANPDIWK